MPPGHGSAPGVRHQERAGGQGQRRGARSHQRVWECQWARGSPTAGGAHGWPCTTHGTRAGTRHPGRSRPPHEEQPQPPYPQGWPLVFSRQEEDEEEGCWLQGNLLEDPLPYHPGEKPPEAPVGSEGGQACVCREGGNSCWEFK